jgi:hypothetical protein
MPRVTKAELAASLEESQTLVRQLQEDLRVERIASGCMNNALDMMHARLERLEKENKALKAERAKRPRSRSPRRFAASSSQVNVDATCKALSQVSLWQRDAVLQEHAEKIAELQAELDKKNEEIVGLRRGNGPIGEVLLHNSNTDDEFTRNYWKAQTTPVRRVIESLHSISRVLDNTIFWGGASDVDLDLMRPVVRIVPR